MKDIIGLRAHVAEHVQEARENKEAAQIVLDEATEELQKREAWAKMIDDYRGVSEDGRRNLTRIYSDPSSGSKQDKIEKVIVEIVGASPNPVRSDEIFQAMIDRGHGDLLAGDTCSKKMARLSNYLTQMHRREHPVLIYDRNNRVFRVAKDV